MEPPASASPMLGGIAPHATCPASPPVFAVGSGKQTQVLMLDWQVLHHQPAPRGSL